MNLKKYAIMVCEFLETKERWVYTKSILEALDIKPSVYVTIRIVLRKLKEADVIQRNGRRKYKWKLVKDWNRQDPFEPHEGTQELVTQSGHIIKPGKSGIVLHAGGISCTLCGTEFRKGEQYVNYKNAHGKERVAHVECVNSHNKAQPDNKPTAWQTEIRNIIEEQSHRLECAEESLAKIKANEKVQIEVINEERVVAKIKGKFHPAFEDVLFHINCGDHVCLIGPRGCGKSMLAEQVADALRLDFGFLSLSGGVTESKLYGRTIPNIHDGKSVYQPTLFTEIWENSGLFLLDELDNGDPNVLVSLNTPLSSGQLAVERPEKPIANRHEKTVIMAAANTWGNGADRQYVGRNQQDAALMERFHCIEMDYDTDLEISLCPGNEDMVRMMHEYRDKIRSNRFEREISTRLICRAHRWMLRGKGLDYIRTQIFGGWRADEIKKVRD